MASRDQGNLAGTGANRYALERASIVGAALWLTHRARGARRLRVAVPPRMLARRYYGSMEAITDSERRSLRPVATTAYDVAKRTDKLLHKLLTIPSVRIFYGVRPGDDGPPIPHAVSAGRQLVLVESVAWPPGRYEMAANGQIHCNGTYIGQSVRPLLAAVRHWRDRLGRRHHVSAVIVVHPAAAEGEITLSVTAQDTLTLVHAGDAARHIGRRLLRGPQTVSRDLVAALIAATDDQSLQPRRA